MLRKTMIFRFSYWHASCFRERVKLLSLFFTVVIPPIQFNFSLCECVCVRWIKYFFFHSHHHRHRYEYFSSWHFYEFDLLSDSQFIFDVSFLFFSVHSPLWSNLILFFLVWYVSKKNEEVFNHRVYEHEYLWHFVYVCLMFRGHIKETFGNFDKNCFHSVAHTHRFNQNCIYFRIHLKHRWCFTVCQPNSFRFPIKLSWNIKNIFGEHFKIKSELFKTNFYIFHINSHLSNEKKESPMEFNITKCCAERYDLYKRIELAALKKKWKKKKKRKKSLW